jgi:hypothetical protein
MLRWLVCVIVLAAVFSSYALSQQSLRDLDSVSEFERALRAVDAIKRQKQLQCVIGIANRALCHCLSQKLPVGTYFRSYASIASQDKDGLDYKQLSAMDKRIVDHCVSDSR